MGHLHASAVTATSTFKAVGPRVSEGERDGWGQRVTATPFPPGPTWWRQGKEKRGTVSDGGDHASDRVGEGEQGSLEWLMSVAFALGGGGGCMDGVHGDTS